MEIRVEESITGQELLDRIVAKYGSEEGLQAIVAKTRDNDVKEDFFTLGLFKEKPERLRLNWKTVEVSTLEPKDLELLTEKRLQLLDAILQTLTRMNVTRLANRMGRDKKNVSRDLAALEKLGLVQLQRSGRQAVPRPAGNVIRIDFRRGRSPQRREKRKSRAVARPHRLPSRA